MNLDKTVMEEEPKSGWGCYKCVVVFLFDYGVHYCLNIGAWVSVVVKMKSITCSEEEKEGKKMKTLDLGGHFFFFVSMFHLGFS